MSIRNVITLLMEYNYKLLSAAPLFLPNAKLFLPDKMKILKLQLGKGRGR